MTAASKKSQGAGAHFLVFERQQGGDALSIVSVEAFDQICHQMALG
jgi:hypothetical protein